MQNLFIPIQSNSNASTFQNILSVINDVVLRICICIVRSSDVYFNKIDNIELIKIN